MRTNIAPLLLLVLVGCVSPKVQYPTSSVRPISLSLPIGFTEADKKEAESRLQPALGSWPQGTRISIAVQTLAIDPRTGLKDKWSNTIGAASEGGATIGAGIGAIVDLLLARVPAFQVTLGATGFVAGAVGGTFVGPLAYGYESLETWKLREYNFIAAIRIETPGKAIINHLFFDATHYPVPAPQDPNDETQKLNKRRESLNELIYALTLELQQKGSKILKNT